jgi:Immunoglobulin V-set domain
MSKCVVSREIIDISAAFGQQAYLDCSTCAVEFGSPVDWWYQKKSDSFSKTVLISSGIINKTENAGMNFSLADDGVSLILNDITPTKAGLYTCVCHGGFGNRKTTNLTVTGKISFLFNFAAK